MSEDLKGLDGVLRKLESLAKRFPNEVASALYQEAQIEKQESMRRTPVDTGALRASHEVSEPDINGRDISVTISVGGATTPYALIVHEDMTAFHKVGEAKFLERTIKESKPFLAARIARRIELSRLVIG